MKKTMMSLLIIAAFASPVFATTNTVGQGQHQGSTSTSNSTSEATNAGNQQSIIFTSPGESTTTIKGSQTVRNVPSVNGPPLVSSNDTCMGSVSGSVNVAGFGGGFGTTYKDTNCVMLKNSRELWNMGMRGAALARMCMDGENRDALEMTGFTCPQTERDRKNQAEKGNVTSPEVTDPYVRQRLGLAPLTEKK